MIFHRLRRHRAVLLTLLALILSSACKHTPPKEQTPQKKESETKRFLSDDEEEELAELMRRAMAKDEEGKGAADSPGDSSPSDKGRFNQLSNKLASDLETKKQRVASQCIVSQREAIAALGMVAELRVRYAKASGGSGEVHAPTVLKLVSDVTRSYGVQLHTNNVDKVSQRPEEVVATATGFEHSVAAGDVWTLDASGTVDNTILGCATPLTDEERADRKAIVRRRLMDVMVRRAPDVASAMVSRRQTRICLSVVRVVQTRLRVFYVSQEIFRAENGVYAQYSELPPQALPSKKEQKYFQFDLVKIDRSGFLMRATGRGNTPAAGLLWEIDEMGIARPVTGDCN